MESIELKKEDIKFHNIVISLTSPNDYEMERFYLLEDLDVESVKYNEYVIAEGYHCSCYDFEDTTWEFMKYTFGDIVVVDDIEIGVIVKCWIHSTENGKEYNYDVYVREYNGIKNYQEKDIQRYMVRHKYLSEEEQEYQYNAINGL